MNTSLNTPCVDPCSENFPEGLFLANQCRDGVAVINCRVTATGSVVYKADFVRKPSAICCSVVSHPWAGVEFLFLVFMKLSSPACVNFAVDLVESVVGLFLVELVKR